MPASIAERLLEAHRLANEAAGLPLGAEAELALKPEQVVFGEAASSIVIPGFEALGRERVGVAVAMVCADRHSSVVAFRQPVDLHRLQNWARRRGLWFSRPGSGRPDLVHRERHAAPGRLLVTAGSTPPSCGALGMLGLACDELEVVDALAGGPVYRARPRRLGVRLFGALAPWAGGQDVALELLHRLGPEGAEGAIVEYGGPGLASLSIADRFALADHGVTLGAMSSLMASDETTQAYLVAQGRGADWKRLEAEEGCEYDRALDFDLSLLGPLVSPLEDPAGVRPAHHWSASPIAQVVIGPWASYADLALAARVLDAHPVHPAVQLIVVPGSRQIEETAAREGVFEALVRAGARLSDGTARLGADGTAAGMCYGIHPDQLAGARARWYLGGPGACAAAAAAGRICDPRELEVEFTRELEPPRYPDDPTWRLEPGGDGAMAADDSVGLPRIPIREPLDLVLRGTVLIRVGDEVGTDLVLPWGARVIPLAGDLSALAEHCFVTVDPEFPQRARARRGGFVVAGGRFGSGTPRLYAALALLELGVRATLALSYAPEFRRHLVQAGVLPLLFTSESDARGAAPGDELEIPALQESLEVGRALTARNLTQGLQYTLRHDLTPLECAIARAGGRLAYAARGAAARATAATAGPAR